MFEEEHGSFTNMSYKRGHGNSWKRGHPHEEVSYEIGDDVVITVSGTSDAVRDYIEYHDSLEDQDMTHWEVLMTCTKCDNQEHFIDTEEWSENETVKSKPCESAVWRGRGSCGNTTYEVSKVVRWD